MTCSMMLFRFISWVGLPFAKLLATMVATPAEVQTPVDHWNGRRNASPSGVVTSGPTPNAAPGGGVSKSRQAADAEAVPRPSRARAQITVFIELSFRLGEPGPGSEGSSTGAGRL